MTKSTKPAFELEMTREIAAPRARVFEAWTKPEQITQWFAPKPFSLVIKSMDFREGGRYEMAMRGPGGEDFPFSGFYKEIVPPSRLVWTGEFSSGPKDQITTVIEFTEKKGKTVVHVVQTYHVMTPEIKHATAGAKQGWTMTLDQLEEFVGGGSDRKIVITRLIDAPKERVWQAWADPKQVEKWWGPFGFQTHTDGRDFRPGGKWKHTMIGPDGHKYPNSAEFIEIVEGEKIVYKNGGAGEDMPAVRFVATVTFKGVGNKTELTMSSEFETPEMRDTAKNVYKAEEGGMQTTARLAALVTGEFIISRLFDAPRERIWKAWTDPQQLLAWMGPKGAEGIASKGDFRAGGRHHYGLRMGGTEIWGLWKILEVAPPERLVVLQSFSDKDGVVARHPMAATWPMTTHSTVTLADFGGKTLVTVHWKPYEATAKELETFLAGRDSMTGGWTGTFDRLDELLAKS